MKGILRMDDHECFMGIALDEAGKALRSGEVPVGAVLVSDEGTVLATAHNCPIASCDPTAHAEIAVLRRASRVVGNYRLPGSTLYVTLEPCVMCLGAMIQARIRVLVFGASDPKGGAAGGVVDLTRIQAFNHYMEVIGGVRAAECADLLTGFFRTRRRKEEITGRGTEAAVTGSTRNRLVL